MITTQRLILKPYGDQDQDRMIGLLTNSKIKETYIIPDFDSPEEAVAMFMKLQEFSLSEKHYELGIYLDNVLIGFINDVEIKNESIELGYVIDPLFHNKGYATEVLEAAINDLFEKGYSEITAAAFIDNIASQKVMEKCKMTLTNREQDIEYGGKLRHAIYYSIKKDTIIPGHNTENDDISLITKA